HDPEIMLCSGESLVGRKAIPFQGLGEVLGDTAAIRIHETEIKLRPWVSLFGQRAKKSKGVCVVVSIKGSDSILQRPRDHLGGKAQHQNDRGDTALEDEVHGL